MRLLRIGRVGQEKPAIRDENGALRDISDQIADISPARLGPDGLDQLRSIDLASCPVLDPSDRIGVPVAGIGKFLAIGLNYSDHAAEVGKAAPSEPILFTKAISSIAGPNDDIHIPAGSTKSDWEVELAVVIGRRAKSVEKSEAMSYVAGALVCNDVSEREYQLERGGSWDKGKGCDTFGPLGPELVTLDEAGDLHNLDMWLDVNGERMQTGNTRTLIFGVDEIVSYVSNFITLEPGDVIATGTPPGVGMGRSPQQFLKSGDIVTLGIAGLGEQRQRVVSSAG